MCERAACGHAYRYIFERLIPDALEHEKQAKQFCLSKRFGAVRGYRCQYHGSNKQRQPFLLGAC